MSVAVGCSPELTEQQRDRNQTDPHPHIDEAEDRIGEQVLAGHHRQSRPRVRCKDEHPGDQPDDRVVDDGGQPRHRVPTDLFEPRLAPGEDQDDEGDRQREDGTDHDEGERQRKVMSTRSHAAVRA